MRPAVHLKPPPCDNIAIAPPSLHPHASSAQIAFLFTHTTATFPSNTRLSSPAMSTSMFRLLFVAVCLSAALVLAAVPADEITSLPGWTGKLPSRHYSGFFPTTLNGSSGGSQGGMLHYWLTLSEREPSKDPLVVWLQGGPGCSSLFGMMYENGQLHFSGEKDNSTGVPMLMQNPYAWTKVANMLWLEQPVGVGFSYCTGNNCSCDSEGCPFGIDAYNFFVNFFRAYVSQHQHAHILSEPTRRRRGVGIGVELITTTTHLTFRVC